MRSSKYSIFTYASMIGVPALLMLILIAMISGYEMYINLFAYVLVIALLVFSTTGLIDVFLHKKYDGSMKKAHIESEIKSNTEPMLKKGSEVDIIVKRFNGSSHNFDKVTYKFFANKFTTVLDALLGIKSHQDSTLAVRCNCRMGICGSCGMVINGRPRLACETNIMEIADSEGGRIEISPMMGHPLLKDTVTEFTDFFERHKSVKPSLYRKNAKEKYSTTKEYQQSSEELDKFLPYSYCIMCGLCLDACPVVNSNPNFIGPQALSQSFRYYRDSRDQKGKRRLFEVDSNEGVWGCEFSGSCSKACPKGVDPATAIQLMKGELISRIAEKDDYAEKK